MYLISSRTIYNPQHTFRHYLRLAGQTVLMCVVFWLCFFSIPTIQVVAKKVFAEQINHAVIGEAPITVELFTTPQQRQKGLSGRASLPDTHGALFIFEEPAYHGIWMPDMQFAIDIVYLNQHNEIIDMKHEVTPDTYPKVFIPSQPALFVLELPAGFAQKHKLKKGDTFTLL